MICLYSPDIGQFWVSLHLMHQAIDILNMDSALWECQEEAGGLRMSFVQDFKLRCRNCNEEIVNDGSRGRRAIYCSSVCADEWNKGYARRKQQEHWNSIAAKLQRLEELEAAIERGELVSQR